MARSVICLLVSIIIWLVADGSGTTFFGHVIIILAGIGTAFNLFTWILSSRIVSLTLIECLFMIGSLVVPLVLAPYLYEGERVSLIQWIGCALVFVSVFLFMDTRGNSKHEGKKFSKIVILTVATLSITVSSVFRKYYTFHITAKGLGSIEYFTFINFVTVLLVFLILFLVYYSIEKRKLKLCEFKERRRVEFPYKKVWIFILIAAASLYVNELFSSYAAQLPSAIYYPLSKGLTVVCTFLLDVIVFHDKLNLKKLLGVATVVLAIVLVNL